MNIMKRSKIFVLMMASAAMLMVAGCKESWLDPKPLSFYTPENTYVDAEGMYAALTAAERNMRHEVCGDAAPILTEYFGTDVAVSGKTDESGTLVDFDSYMLPTTLYNSYKNKLLWYWQEGFNGVKYANIVISRIDNATYESDAERNAVLGSAYFQRAYRYYKLTHQFGDVPFLDQEITSPKVDFYSNDRWSILEKLEEDLEFAYEWVSDDVDRGRTSKSACGVLLMKVAMCLGHFDRALEVGQEIVANHPLMTERFTTNQTKANTNLMHDLHSVEAKLDITNTEGLMYVVSYPYVEGSARMCIMRNALPYWAKGAAIVTPDGLSGTTISPASGDEGTYLDNDYNYGRGIGVLRPSNYYQYDIWAGEKEKNDLRGPNGLGSWVQMTDLYYNNPGLKGKSEWYGKHLVRPANMNVSDTVRCWYSWPHYKLFVPDPTKNTDRQGGETPWYIYRSAEVYLLMAECYYWKDMPEEEAEMLNVVRERAQAEPLTSSEVGMEAILAERARELYYEEMRHTELVRISYTYARTGHPCEIFNNRVYTLDNFSGPGGTGSNVKEEGYNFWYDWVMKVNNFFRERVEVANGTYTISVHHVLWPVPNSAITANTKGVINQNIGYPGAENNITPLAVGETYSGE
jgi:hypothetical protein